MIKCLRMDDLGYGAPSGLSKLPGFLCETLIINNHVTKCWIGCIEFGNTDGHRHICQEICDSYRAGVTDAIVFQRLVLLERPKASLHLQKIMSSADCS